MTNRRIIKIVSLVSSVFIVSLSLFYFFQINSEVGKETALNSLKKRAASVSKENQVLEVKSEIAGSLDNVVASLKPLNLQKTDKVYYLKPTNGEVGLQTARY